MLEKIKVGGVTYDVVEKEYIELSGGRNYQGVCCYGDTEIQIIKSLSAERKEQTLVHELTHAIFYEAGFEEQDEDMINRLSIVLHQVLQDNYTQGKTTEEYHDNS